MATKAEAITTVPTTTQVTRPLKRHVARFTAAARGWARKGQLGSSASTEMGRHSGARI